MLIVKALSHGTPNSVCAKCHLRLQTSKHLARAHDLGSLQPQIAICRVKIIKHLKCSGPTFLVAITNHAPCPEHVKTGIPGAQGHKSNSTEVIKARSHTHILSPVWFRA
jgi:hypothetical protein